MRGRSTLVFVIFAEVIGGGCKPRQPISQVASAPSYVPARSHEYRMSWFTNRDRDWSRPGAPFTGNPSPVLPNKGVAFGLLPASYRFGAASADPERLERDDVAFNQDLINSFYDEGRYQQQATVFVHGYNNTVDDAMMRARQMWMALENPRFAGQRPFRTKYFVYSWPSLGKTIDDRNMGEWIRTGYPFFARAYHADEQAAAVSVGPLVDLLGHICGSGQLYRNINVVAHSLGTRLASESLAAISRAQQRQAPSPSAAGQHMPCRVRNLVLASGDMGMFRFREILPDLLLIADHITLYVNARLLEQMFRISVTADLPLALSKMMHFFHKFELGPRIGQESLLTDLLDRNVDVVVMKHLDDGAEGGGHNHIFTSPTVLSDLTYLLNGEPSPLRTVAERIGRRVFDLR